MVIKIDNPIADFEVISTEGDPPKIAEMAPENEVIAGIEGSASNVIQMHEKLERPEMLIGSTYKIKTPLSEHALYVTINDLVLNPETPYEKRQNMDHFQWIVALTRIISAVFRKGGDATFLVEELRSVFDPQGGYFKRGGKYTPSLVAEIGDAIEAHMKMIGMIREDDLDDHQQKLVDDKRQEYETRKQPSPEGGSATGFPAEARLCSKCQTKAVVLLDGCMTCLNCGDSKCG